MSVKPGTPLYNKLVRQGRITPDGKPQATRRKYGNQPTINACGERFDSKLEERVYGQLRAAYGDAGVVRQVSIPVGDKRIRPDFLIIHSVMTDGRFIGELADAKGHATEGWTAKANHLKDKHGLSIREIKK